MKKLVMCVMLFAFAVPFAMAESIVINPQKVALDGAFEDLQKLPKGSQRLVAEFLDSVQKGIKATDLRQAVLPKGVEDTEAINAILPFITGVEQDYYTLADKDAQAAEFVGNLLYTSKFYVKDGAFTIPNFITKYRSYIETRTDLDRFYNDIFADAQAMKK